MLPFNNESKGIAGIKSALLHNNHLYSNTILMKSDFQFDNQLFQEKFLILLSWIKNPLNLDMLANIPGLDKIQQYSISKLLQIFQSFLKISQNSTTDKLTNPSHAVSFPKYQSEAFYSLAFSMYNKTRHYERAKSQMAGLYPQLDSVSTAEFRQQCQQIFPKFRASNQSLQKDNSEKLSEIPQSNCNLNVHYYNKLPPNEPRRIGRWSIDETQKLIDCIYDGVKNQLDYIGNDGDVKWGLLSLKIPGRTGSQCQEKYENLLAKEKILDVKQMPCEKMHSEFLKISQKALLPDQEQKLVDEIETMLNENKMVTSGMIAEMARNIYNQPEHLAQKAAINHFIDEECAFLDDEGNYTENVMELTYQLLEKAEQEPQEIINKYSIPSFKASRSWVSKFMERHKYVYRKAHYARRQMIQPDSVTAYIHHLNDAFERYGSSRVLNMDETQVLLNNFPTYTIARQGQQTVNIDKGYFNLKSGTTYIGTIAMDPAKRFPLYCISKGLTPVCERKYENVSEEECKMDHSSSGWCTVDVMKKYLVWLSKLMGNEPFALVLDIYRTHHTDDVKQLATNLGIELIFVPANGTGFYQPLDRKIFGIVKQKLSETTSKATRAEQFAAVHQKVINIWRGLNNSAIESAWDIDGLDCSITRDLRE